MLRERLDELPFWIDYMRAVRQVEEAGLGDFLAQLHKALPPGQQLVRAHSAALYSRLGRTRFRPVTPG